MDNTATVTGVKEDNSKERIGDVEKCVVVKIEETSNDRWLGANKRGRKVGFLWLSDALLLCLEHLQMFALILSLSLAWAWPQVWIRGTSFAFLLNLDLWEFAKTHTVYAGREQAFPDPIQVPFNYLGYSIAWIVFLISGVSLFGIVYVLLPKVPSLNIVDSLLLRAKLVRLFTLIAQALCFPFGLVLIRLFNCQNYASGSNRELVFRSIVLDETCWSPTHLGVLVPMLILAFAYFIVLPCWMIHIIRKQLLFPIICTYNTCNTHENYLRLKEAEYIHGLDIAWEIKHYSLFASFQRPWVWFRPLSFFVKAILLILYGSFFYLPYYQSIVMLASVGGITLALSALPVYRIRSFNFMLIFSVTVNICNCVLGLLLELRVQSALLLGIHLNSALIVINATWLLVAIVWLSYLVVRNLNVVKMKNGPFWPTLTNLNRTSKQKSNNIRKYFKAILASRKVLEICYSGPALFAPVHKLSRQIQIINAYCRETEAVKNSTHDLLWALLNEMIDTHNYLLTQSVYGASKTNTVLPHIQQLMNLMPDFTKRLEQREYDLILWVPHKRRILLKLLAIITFLNILKRSSSYKRDCMEEEEDEEEVVKRKSIKQVSNKSEYAISHEHTPFSPTTYTRSIGSSYGPSVTTLCHEIERPISTTGSTHGASCGNYV